jgi:hypothetical protein
MASLPRNVAPTKVVELEKGLYLFRYVSSTARSAAPVVSVACEHGSERAAALISAPGYPAGTLERPGDALVVLARQPARLSVRVRASVPDGSVEADVNIERLGRSVEQIEGINERAKFSEGRRWGGTAASDRTAALELLAHVARVGDVSVPAGEWAAGPDNPARIEGLSLKWRRGSHHPDLKYAVRVDGDRSSTLVWGNGDGSFVGTRGQARPLTEVRFALAGQGAENSELVVEALFQGAPPMRAEGREIRLTGPSGREALIGLRVDFVDLAREDDAREIASTRTDRSSSRVRVFRSGPQIQR